MTDWVTASKKAINKSEIKTVRKSKAINNLRAGSNLRAESNLSFEEIDDIFENLYGDYIEESIIDMFQYEKKYTYLLNNTTPCDIEILFYSFINKEESIPGKYKIKEDQCKDNDIFSDDEY